ncbi:zeaxanthin epoxidase, chloroplastic [Sesbania bispinosa]|nr:zeaxanthin epoxidase, chloroplastic [Sesbania bispinosa]
MASSTLSYNSLNPSMAAFSRTHFSIPMYKELSVDNTKTEQPNRGRNWCRSKRRWMGHHLLFQSQHKEWLKMRKGFEVVVFEKDLSAIRGEGQYRGPIQIQRNALAALEALDFNIAEEVMRVACITGDRINGLVDGISGSWGGVAGGGEDGGGVPRVGRAEAGGGEH